MNKEVKKRIASEKKIKSGKLYLGDCDLSEIPAEISGMVWLTELSFYKNKIKQIQNLETLINLNSLDLRYNEIKEINNLDALTQLKVLDLSGNLISEIKNLDRLFTLEELSIGNLISVIKNLDHLANLRKLSLQRNRIQEIKNISHLINLNTLSLYSNKIKTIQNLKLLTNLQSLSLANNEINKIINLDELSNLQTLFLGGASITEIKNLGFLSNLQSLYLDASEIEEIKNLDELVNLRHLNLNSNRIREIKNLDRLTKLEGLQLGMNQITEIKNLDALVNLEDLNLNGNQIREIKNLNSLYHLKQLSLVKNKIVEIKNLNKLHSLEILELDDNPITCMHNLPQLVAFPKLKTLKLKGVKENDLNIPPEIFQYATTYGYNCLETLRGYFASLKKGQYQLKEVPVILVGNSTAGKTSLRYFLQRNIFPPPDDHSTHGIEGSIWQPDDELLENFTDKEELKSVQFCFWDFGGQEYYHATHRLFFSKKAIYILVWEQKTNKQTIENIPIRVKGENGEITATNLPVELFPYTYWINSIRHYATKVDESPILLVQNKIDEVANNSEEYPDPSLIKNNNCNVVQVSIKKAYETGRKGQKDPHVDIFLHKFFSAAKKLSSNIIYGALWQDIKKMLQESRSENIWSRQRFLQELKWLDASVQENSMLSYALSLRAMGVIIFEHDDDFLSDCIFINPGWVTEMIYLILDHSVLENNGEFDTAHIIQRVGREHSDIFIALMKKFELIFEDKELGIFIAPQYLPSELKDNRKSSELRARFDFDQPDLVLQFTEFMPRNIMLRFLAAFGEKAIGRYYWKSGISFIIEKSSVLLLCDYYKKQFRVFTEDSNRFVLRLVLDKLVEIIENTSSFMISSGGNDFVVYNDLQKAFELGNTKVESVNGTMLELSRFSHFFTKIQAFESPRTQVQTKTIKIFISYAHVDDKIRKIFEERYLKTIQNHYAANIEIWSDVKLKPGTGWNNIIINEVNAADIVIFFLSNGFLASNYIKEIEIEKALTRYKNRQQIIVPVYIEEIPKKLFPFSGRQYLPGGKPLREWRPQSKAWVKVVEGVIGVIDDIKAGNTDIYYK